VPQALGDKLPINAVPASGLIDKRPVFGVWLDNEVTPDAGRTDIRVRRRRYPLGRSDTTLFQADIPV
jgi:hypothetical protein